MNAPISHSKLTSHSEFVVPGMRCAGCIAKIEDGLAQAPGVRKARVNFSTRRVAVDHEPTIDIADLRAALADLGFNAEPAGLTGDLADRTESRRLLKALAVAGFASMNVMLLSVSVWSGADGATRQMFHWLSAMIAIPTVAYAGRPFFQSAWSALRKGRTNMDVPISIGVGLATLMSLYETVINGPHAYFDGAVSLLFFLLAGRVLDQLMRDRARDGAAVLLRQTAPGGMIRQPDGSTLWMPAREIAAGMDLIVSVGERFAADGRITDGNSRVDRSLVTGESALEPVSSGSLVLAGTMNVEAPVTVSVTAAGPDTAIAGMARLMEAAGQGRSRYVRIADRAARLYAPAVHTLALASFIGWMIAGVGWHQALLIATAVLIITCPCALGLAVPVAQVVAAGSLMRRGILIKDGSALERLAEADTACFDKTGTLTLGRPAPDGALPLTDADKPVALALAQASRHPISAAVARVLESEGIRPATMSDMRETAGQGMEGYVDGRRARLGRPGWIDSALDADPRPGAAFAIDGQPAVMLSFADPLRPDAEAALARLTGMGMSLEALSGDRADPVAAIAHALHIPARAALTPADKVTAIEELQHKGHHVLMVGDGLNDGPALAAGHVSMAPASASDVGQTAADMVFLGDSLLPVPIAVAASRRTLRVVRQNFLLAIGYNVLAVPLALMGMVTPLVAAIAMSTSSILVVANALRLRSCAR